MKISSLVYLSFVFLPIWGFAQENEEEKASLDGGADIVSRYVWRGLDYGTAPAIQPHLDFNKSGFGAGCWGSYNITGGYAEVDLYASYTKGIFSLMVTDYFLPKEVFQGNNIQSNHYFKYEKGTGHIFEGMLTVGNSEKIPLTFLVATSFYGADLNEKGAQNLSTYLELAYSGAIGDTKVNIFGGFTTHEGLYGEKLGFVNVGISASKEIKLTDNFSLPVHLTFLTNPMQENIHFIFGISL